MRSLELVSTTGRVLGTVTLDNGLLSVPAEMVHLVRNRRGATDEETFANLAQWSNGYLFFREPQGSPSRAPEPLASQ
jgi:hypothetical protein